MCRYTGSEVVKHPFCMGLNTIKKRVQRNSEPVKRPFCLFILILYKPFYNSFSTWQFVSRLSFRTGRNGHNVSGAGAD